MTSEKANENLNHQNGKLNTAFEHTDGGNDSTDPSFIKGVMKSTELQRSSNGLPGLALGGAGLSISWHDISWSIEERPILQQVSGICKPGQMMAIMGPSGSGKTSLLNILSGRKPYDDGLVLLGGQPMAKTLRRQLCYVLQQDIFFPTLTLKETLWFTAMLRLPGKMSKLEKQMRIDDLVSSLDLTKCEDTIIGDAMTRGLSGGEKKRANIACELLTNPKVLLLDEPTSGLDSSTALDLMKTMKHFSQTHNKTVITTIHQPSSQIFHMFDHMLLLAEGQMAYYGGPHDICDYFAECGMPCEQHFNPADFILEKVRSTEDARKALIEAGKELRQRPTWPLELQDSLDSVKEGLKKKGFGAVKGGQRKLRNNGSTPTISRDSSAGELVENVGFRKIDPDSVAVEVFPDQDSLDQLDESSPGSRWPTSWWLQYKVLTQRNFKHARGRVLSKLSIIQTALLTAVVSTVWFQLPRKEETLIDRNGLIFFAVLYWGFNPLFDAVMAFPGERPVINKERSSGAYRLSAYYCAKMTSELPLVIIQPLAFMTVVYWATGMGSIEAFFPTLVLLVLSSITAQSLGLFISASVIEFKTAITIAAVSMLTCMLLGGFYTRTIPFWLEWAKWLSFILYTFSSLLYLEYGVGKPIECASPANSSSFEACHTGNITNIPVDDLLKSQAIDMPLYFYVLITVAFMILFRFLGYLMLRYRHKPHTA